MTKGKNTPASFAAEVVKQLKTEQPNQVVSEKVQSLFTTLYRVASGRLAATVRSAVPLTNQEKQTMEKKISSLVGAPVSLNYWVDPDLLTGFRVSVGGLLIDTSGKRTLSHMYG